MKFYFILVFTLSSLGQISQAEMSSTSNENLSDACKTAFAAGCLKCQARYHCSREAVVRAPDVAPDGKPVKAGEAKIAQ